MGDHRIGAGNGVAPVCPPLPHSVLTVVVKGVLDDGCCCHAVISVMVVTCWQGFR